MVELSEIDCVGTIIFPLISVFPPIVKFVIFAVGIVTVPVKIGLLVLDFCPMAVYKLFTAFVSSFNAVAISYIVFNVAGAEPIKLLNTLRTYPVVATKLPA